ncbi:electron transfer flavoprotein subunit alpha/FixB family protein [Cellulomonas sp. P4]|uniref:electron transfer flavoprotein subunit alpha/FixB family protein n=1 Tax=Cellulomonas sp. P4 TaxID=3142533 RepID=UPI0031BAB93F
MTTYILTAGDARIGRLVELAAGPTTVVVVGDGRTAAAVARTPGVDRVLHVEPAPGAPAETCAAAVAGLVADAAPALVLAAPRPADRVLAGAVAARLAAPVLTMVRAVEVADGGVEVTRSVFGGIAERTERVTGPAVVVTDGGTAADGGSAPVVDAGAAPADPAVTVTATRVAERAAVDLSRAPRVVAAGRGVRRQEDLALVEGLAAALGAEVACSRPLAEGVGWLPHDRYVGVTGQHVAPELYVAAGVSGQLQHVVGARGAGTVVAINTDPGCPYFAEADYCVVGDLYEVLPALTAALAAPGPGAAS